MSAGFAAVSSKARRHPRSRRRRSSIVHDQIYKQLERFSELLFILGGMAEASAATTIPFSLPKRCEAAWKGQRHLRPQTKGYRGGGAWHGGGIACGQGEQERRHSYTRSAR